MSVQETGGEDTSVAYELWKQQYCLVYRVVHFICATSGAKRDPDLEENLNTLPVKLKKSWVRVKESRITWVTSKIEKTWRCKERRKDVGKNESGESTEDLHELGESVLEM